MQVFSILSVIKGVSSTNQRLGLRFLIGLGSKIITCLLFLKNLATCLGCSLTFFLNHHGLVAAPL